MADSNFDPRKAIKHLADKWGPKPACPMCKKMDWTVFDSLVSAVPFVPRGLSIGGTAAPLVAVMCRNCGCTIFVNAMLADVFEPKDNAGEAPVTDEEHPERATQEQE